MDLSLLLKEIRNGNQDSFKRLFHLYYEPLVNYAEGYVFDRASSEDIVQEVFIHFWEHANTINITTSLKGYLYKMVRNRGLNYLKTLKITDKLEVLEYSQNTEPYFLNDDIQEEKIKRFNEVQLCIETMPERMKAVFNLKYRSHYSHLEISNELGISINTIKTQLKRAKILLQSQFPFYFLFFCLHIAKLL